MLDKQFVLNYYIRTELDIGNQVSTAFESCVGAIHNGFFGGQRFSDAP
jgi:hypothetical protein